MHGRLKAHIDEFDFDTSNEDHKKELTELKKQTDLKNKIIKLVKQINKQYAKSNSTT